MTTIDPAVKSYIDKHGDRCLINAIRASDYDLFKQLLDVGQSVDANDYIDSRDGSLPVLPIHVAAANPNPMFLQTLLQRGADPNDDCQYDNPSFDNTFRAAVRAAQWDNVTVIIEAGGVEGNVDCDYFWAERHRYLCPTDCEDEEDDELAKGFIHSLFQNPWDDLANVTLPESESLRRRSCVSRYDSLGSFEENCEPAQELSNLEWIITADVPHLDDTRRRHIIDKLIRNGADISAFTNPSSIVIWDIRGKALSEQVPNHAVYYESPMHSLGATYHMTLTPIHTCVLLGNETLLRYFVSEAHLNIDIPEFTTRAATPLLLAIESDDLTLSKTLFDLKARIDFVTPIMHLTAVHFAASTHNLSLLQWVIDMLRKTVSGDSAAKIFKQKSILGHTALHVACMPHDGDIFSGNISESIHYVVPRLSTGATASSGFARTDLPSRAFFIESLCSIGAGSWRDADHQGNTPAHFLAAMYKLRSAGHDASSAEILGVLQEAMKEVEGLHNQFGHSVGDLLL